MRELDQILERYLDRAWPAASADERAAFERLLDTEDDVLWDWCQGHGAPADAALGDVVRRLRGHAPG